MDLGLKEGTSPLPPPDLVFGCAIWHEVKKAKWAHGPLPSFPLAFDDVFPRFAPIRSLWVPRLARNEAASVGTVLQPSERQLHFDALLLVALREGNPRNKEREGSCYTRTCAHALSPRSSLLLVRSFQPKPSPHCELS